MKIIILEQNKKLFQNKFILEQKFSLVSTVDS